MILLDVNVLVYAFREDVPEHPAYAAWLRETIGSDEACGLSDVVLSGVIRIVTNPRVFRSAAPTDRALAFTNALREQPNAIRVDPGARHWPIFSGLCANAGVKGDLAPDAWLAALAIESGAELITADRGFARFPGLRWRHPVQAGSEGS